MSPENQPWNFGGIDAPLLSQQRGLYGVVDLPEVGEKGVARGQAVSLAVAANLFGSFEELIFGNRT